jgi:hypothetical protein
LRGEKAAGCVGVWQHSTRAREEETRETPKISARFCSVVRTKMKRLPFFDSVSKNFADSTRVRENSGSNPDFRVFFANWRNSRFATQGK